MQVQDGVTFHAELEFGACDVAAWYEHRRGKQLIHYGVSAGHIPNRVSVLSKPDQPHQPHSADPHMLSTCFCCQSGTHLVSTDASQTAAIVASIRAGVEAGALGIGLGIAYTSAADHEEIYRVFQLGAKLQVPLYIHHRGSFNDMTDFHEMYANAAASGCSLHLCHVNSSCSGKVNLPLVLEMMDDLNQQGIDVTAESYSYTAGMTRLDSGIFEPGI